MPYAFARKTLKQLCLLRGHATLFQQLSKCSNDVHILGNKKVQMQRQLCLELNNCTQGPFGPNECDRRIHLWVDNEADGIVNPLWDDSEESKQHYRDEATCRDAENGVGNFAYPPAKGQWLTGDRHRKRKCPMRVVKPLVLSCGALIFIRVFWN